jgi:hypothetical protein
VLALPSDPTRDQPVTVKISVETGLFPCRLAFGFQQPASRNKLVSPEHLAIFSAPRLGPSEKLRQEVQ